jgi:hypothetical protein
MRFRVLFTVDYEIHGNGHGSPRELMVEPTERMLAQLDRHGAKLTVMADMAEIERFRRHRDETGRDEFDYERIRAQLVTAVRTGHDVQLHLHPSFYESRYRNGHLEQDYAAYDLARLPYERLERMVRESKTWLEGLLRPVDPAYRCIAFRAANWSMNPSGAILKALVANGIFIDTSVFKGGKRDGMVHFDYSDAESALVPWPVDWENVCRRNPAGSVVEFPIYCEPQPIWRFVTFNRIYRAVQGRLNPLPLDEYGGPDAGRGGLAAKAGRALRLLMQRHPWKLDFNQCSGRQLIDALRRIETQYAGHDAVLPVVLIGHSKIFTRWNERSLEPFLRFVSGHRDRFGFGTFRDFDRAAFARAKAARARRLEGPPKACAIG